MAFAQPIPRPFTEQAIRMYAPAVPGVYGISNASQWIHVGEGQDIQAGLMAALHGNDPKMRQLGPTGFVYEACGEGTRVERHARLKAEYRPVWAPSGERSADRAGERSGSAQARRRLG